MKKNTKKITEYLYGAYGSNLNKTQMKVRCPNAKVIGSCEISGHALKFRGVADVETADQNSSVALGLWQITKKCLKALDKYEGYPNLYTKRFLNTEHGKVMIYVMCDQDSVYPPCDSYLSSIADGYFDFDLNSRLLKAAVEHSYTHQNNGVSLDFMRV